ncbi:disease resistance protein RPP8-like [Carex rostrata]
MKMLKEIGSERQNEGEEYLITELNKCMRERKYLVVLDDIWSSNVWTVLQVALPDTNNGSRVLITTRFIHIAEEADIISTPYKINPLNEEEGRQLLLNKVFPNRFANECPNEVLPLATQFAKKCGGWPLPLVVLGEILSRKNPDYITWDEVLQNMNWQIDGSGFMGVISTSYEDLPTSLKPCFMYFGVFPEDHQIKATTLIHLWIAEGFIRQEGTKVLEDIAESYLEELVQRCMVKVSKRSCIGKIKYCHIHDLLRDLAIQKAKESNFLTVVSKNDTNLSCSTCTRRIALHGYGDKMIEHAGKKNIRSLINYEDVPNLNRFGMLRVLHMSEAQGEQETNCLKVLNTLMALKYFRLDSEFYGSDCRFPTVRFFKRSPLTNMKNLQTVRTWFCKSHGELPQSFWGNKQLRHINLSCCWECEATPEGPPSAADLQSLLTLEGVRARQDWVTELPKFPYLRKLGIDIPEDVAGEPLMNSLSNLNHLGSLDLNMAGDNCRMTFSDCISAFRNLNHLYSFTLQKGRWPRKEIGDCTLFPPHLVKLTLREFSFEEDPMPQLEKLPNLKVLDLWYSSMEAVDGKCMICSRGGFGRLQRLFLWVEDLEEWKIEDGAMPMLNQLKLEYCKLQIVPHLQYLVNLQELTVDCLDEFKSRLEGEDQWKINHIPSVKIYLY